MIIKPLIYVAGPISSDPVGAVRKSMPAFFRLRAQGAIPYMPQWSTIAEMINGAPYEFWTELDFDVIRRCDALIRLDGTSPGADREVELAEELGIPWWPWPTKTLNVQNWISDWIVRNNASAPAR